MCKDCEECERYHITTDEKDGVSGLEMCTDELELGGIERCPWPSKRKEKLNKYQVAYDLYLLATTSVVRKEASVEFECACREAGLQ